MNMYILYKVQQSTKALKRFKHPARNGTENGQKKTDVVRAENGGSEESKKERQRQEAETHLTRMLLLITSSFFVFTSPSFCRYAFLFQLYTEQYNKN